MTEMTPGIGWERIREARERAGRALRPLHRYPVVGDSRQVLVQQVKEGDAILDIGANDRNVERYLAAHAVPVQYFSCDIDRSLHHDYHDLGDIDRSFDVACMFDVIEHVSPRTAMDMINSAFTLLRPGGRLLVSTPNVDHPTRFWRDSTHITPFRYDELAGFMIAAGFEDIRIMRIARLRWQDRIRRIWAAPVLRLLRIDYAPSILAIGVRQQ